MPRTESYLLRLSKSEKDQLAYRASIEGCSIAKLIRWKTGLDTKEEPEREKTTSATVEDIRAQIAEDEFKILVARHKLRMPLPAAERLARKELDAQ